MNIQKISLPQIVSFSGKDDDKKNIKKEPQTLKQPEASAQDALDSMGRAQIINMPQRPKKLKTIEEKCDYFIDKYKKKSMLFNMAQVFYYQHLKNSLNQWKK